MEKFPNRIIAYDHARALAIMGMIVVNTQVIMDIRVLEPWWMNSFTLFLCGRAAVVFVMLTGAGMVMAYDRAPETTRPLLIRRMIIRAALLYMVGLLLLTVWNADILHYYTTYLLAGVLLLEKRTNHLKKILAVVVAISIPFCVLAFYEYEGGDFFEGYFTREPLSHIVNYFFLGEYYPVFPWFCFFLIGMLLGRLERLPVRWKYKIIFIGSSILLITVELLSVILNAETITGRWIDIEMPWWRALSQSEAFPVGPLFLFSASASGLAMIALLRLLPERQQPSNHPSPMVAFGRLSLTFYVSHILISCAWSQWVVTQHKAASSNQVLCFAAVFILAGIVFADRWMRHFRRGPLEMAVNELMCAFLRLKQEPLQQGR
ncbi:hypothetical protein Dvar_33990 [Desulfosarcina variabilis str. Montpellier]|uniref:DUF418 domain-containing protein n=1 Tax=Desulfosarcina variabilis TaxID=2300 RepID=UPI003AFB2116